MIAYKLFRKRKDGTLGPLFINRKFIVPFNKWVSAESHPTKGYALRPGWHTTPKPEAKHLSMKDRVWAKVEIKDYYKFDRPKHQGGYWLIANSIKVLEEL